MIMGLFNTPKANQGKAAAAVQAYGMDILTDPADQEAIQRIMASLAVMDLINQDNPLGGAQIDRINAHYLRAIFEQNNIIIRQLERLIQKNQ